MKSFKQYFTEAKRLSLLDVGLPQPIYYLLHTSLNACNLKLVTLQMYRYLSGDIKVECEGRLMGKKLKMKDGNIYKLYPGDAPIFYAKIVYDPDFKLKDVEIKMFNSRQNKFKVWRSNAEGEHIGTNDVNFYLNSDEARYILLASITYTKQEIKKTFDNFDLLCGIYGYCKERGKVMDLLDR